MKLPEEIKIGVYTIPINFREEMGNQKGNFVFPGYPGGPAINIMEGMTEEANMDTFLHEVTEAIDNIYDLKLQHSIIQLFGVSLAQALKEIIDKGE